MLNTQAATSQPAGSYALLGLLFDAVTLEQAKQRIRSAIAQRKQLLIATPNVNFVAMAASDKTFRTTVLQCDLSLADGMPIYWLAKWLNIPLPGRVAGSSLIESLQQDTGSEPIKVFFFGGEGDAANTAHQKLNQQTSGLISVGALNPGFGSVESMSTDAIIDEINTANPDFLIVSLGAKKGHLWLEANKQRLHAPVMSHLGAVVNFIAGTQQRSPAVLQRLGLEWLWRIYQQPALCKRYAGDAIVLAKMILGCCLPLWLTQRTPASQPPEIDYDADRNTVSIIGQLSDPLPSSLISHMHRAIDNPDHHLTIDMEKCSGISSQFSAILLKQRSKPIGSGDNLTLINMSKSLARQLHYYGVKFTNA